MIVRVDASSGVPPYEQLRAQIETLVASGVLRVSARLPTIRQLAGDLGVAPGTVARAYAELEAAGVVRTDGRRGTFVVDVRNGAAGISAAERGRRLTAAAGAFALAVRQLGVDPKVAINEVNIALGRR